MNLHMLFHKGNIHSYTIYKLKFQLQNMSNMVNKCCLIVLVEATAKNSPGHAKPSAEKLEQDRQEIVSSTWDNNEKVHPDQRPEIVM